MWHHTTIVLPRERLLFCDLVTSVPRAADLGPPYCARKESEEPVSYTLQPGGSGLSLCSAGEQRKGILDALHRGKVCMIILPMQKWLSQLQEHCGCPVPTSWCCLLISKVLCHCR